MSSSSSSTNFNTDKYYKQFNNPNLFISNNANPFLISPFSPKQTGAQQSAIVEADTLTSFTSGATIQVDAPMTVNAQLTVMDGGVVSFEAVSTGVQISNLFVDNIAGQLTNPVLVNSDMILNDSNFSVEFGGTPVFGVQSGTASFNVPLTVPSLTISPTATLPAAAPVTLQGYVPINVNGTTYYTPYYSSP